MFIILTTMDLKNMIPSFKKYLNEISYDLDLNESLNSTVEFYMTDQTNMPNEIYAAYELKGSDYGMSLIKSQWDGVYILDFYYIKNKYKKKWAVLQTGDIKYSLSTLIKFFESAVPFLGSKLKGVILQLPTAKKSEKYVRLLNLVIKKSHIKTFRTIPIVKNSDKAQNYIFLIKKNIEPTALFKGVKFSKHFIFDKDSSDVSMDSDAMDIAGEYYKTPKNTVSLKPNDILAFGKLKVEITASDQLVNILDAAFEKFKAEPEKEPQKVEPEKEPDYNPKIRVTTSDSPTLIISDNTIEIPYGLLFAYLFPKGYENIKKYGYDVEKIDEDNLNYVLKTTIETLPNQVRKSLLQKSIMNGTEFNFGNSGNKPMILAMLKNMENVEADGLQELKDVFDKMHLSSMALAASKPKNVPDEVVTQDPDSTKLELDFDFSSPLESFKGSNDSKAKGHGGNNIPFLEKNENSYQKKYEVYNMPKITKWFEDPKKEESEGYELLRHYSGVGYYYMNSELRTSVDSENLNYSKLAYNVKKLSEYFEENAPVLDNAIWVYRNAGLPKQFYVGDNFIDPAFLSCTVSSHITMGEKGDSRMKIYLPVGTKMFPIFDESKNPQEDEIILPPLSCLRIIEKTISDNGKICYTAVMLGSANKSLIDSGDKGVF